MRRREFLALATSSPITAPVAEYRLPDANQAPDDAREGRIEGATVLVT